MRYLIVSDTHGKHRSLREVVEKVGYVDGMFHLGDVEKGLDDISEMIDYPFYGVKGNNDFGVLLEDEKIVPIGEHRVFMTHGHRYSLFFGVDRLVALAKEKGCDVVLFGHTHVPYLEEKDGVWIANPGSVSLPRQLSRKPTYLLMELDSKGKLHFTQAELD